MDNRKCHMEHFLLTHQPFLSQRAWTAGAPLDRELQCEGPQARQERGPPRRHVPHRKCDLAADPHQRSSASKRPTHEMLTFANETSRPPDRRAIRSAVSAPINKRPSVFPLTFQPVGAEKNSTRDSQNVVTVDCCRDFPAQDTSEGKPPICSDFLSHPDFRDFSQNNQQSEEYYSNTSCYIDNMKSVKYLN